MTSSIVRIEDADLQLAAYIGNIKHSHRGLIPYSIADYQPDGKLRSVITALLIFAATT